ncbi:MAG TPA: PaaI family thioesterase [Acidimicrobiales bacterium]|nr:PaaI family thioesterase [Acidimicrobiales bacterium]
MDAQPALAFDSFDPTLADFLLGPDSGLADGIAGYLGMRMVEVTPGRAVLELEARDELVHGFGALHGGVVAALIDQALGSAVFPLVPAGTWPATLEFKLNYLAAVRGGTVRATGQVIALRSRTAVVRVDVGNEGRAVATALGTISLNRPNPE